MPLTISQRERNELRSMIRARFKALRAGVEQRRADQLAEVERQINLRYAEQKRIYEAANRQATQMAAELNARLRELFAPIVGDHPEHGACAVLSPGKGPDLNRKLMRARAPKEVDAAAKATLCRLADAEATALEAVARTAIESDEAHRVLAGIPTVEWLMPAVEIPAVAEATVAEMADGSMPWRATQYLELGYDDMDWDERNHLRQWREAQAALPPAAEE